MVVLFACSFAGDTELGFGPVSYPLRGHSLLPCELGIKHFLPGRAAGRGERGDRYQQHLMNSALSTHALLGEQGTYRAFAKAGPQPGVHPGPGLPQSPHRKRTRGGTLSLSSSPQSKCSHSPLECASPPSWGLYLCRGRAHGVWSSEWSSRERRRLQGSKQLGTVRPSAVTGYQGSGVYNALRWGGTCVHSGARQRQI